MSRFLLCVPDMSRFAHFCSHILMRRCSKICSDLILIHEKNRPGPRWGSRATLPSPDPKWDPPTRTLRGARLGLWCHPSVPDFPGQSQFLTTCPGKNGTPIYHFFALCPGCVPICVPLQPYAYAPVAKNLLRFYPRSFVCSFFEGRGPTYSGPQR